MNNKACVGSSGGIGKGRDCNRSAVRVSRIFLGLPLVHVGPCTPEANFSNLISNVRKGLKSGSERKKN